MPTIAQEYTYGDFKDGGLIWGHGELQVSRRDHDGIAFVNTSIPNCDSASSSRNQSKRKYKVRFQQPRADANEFFDSGRNLRLQQRPRKASTRAKSVEVKRESSPKETVRRERQSSRLQQQKQQPKKTSRPQLKQTQKAKNAETITVRYDSPAAFSLTSSSSSSSSASSPSSPPTHQEEGIPQSLSGWLVHQLPFNLTHSDKMSLRYYFDIMPRRTYPFEMMNVLSHNPLRSQESCKILFSEELVVRSAVCIGSICQAFSENMGSQQVAHHSGELCRLVSLLLKEPGPDTRRHVLVQAISTLALAAHMSGQDELYHMHMSGLEQLVQSAGGVDALTPVQKWIAYKADISPASDLALGLRLTPPFLLPDAARGLENLTGDDRDRVERVFRRWVWPCCTDEKVYETFVVSALFVASLRTAKLTNYRFDPDVVMENWHHNALYLVNYPSPLCEGEHGSGGNMTTTTRTEYEPYSIYGKVPFPESTPAPYNPDFVNSPSSSPPSYQETTTTLYRHIETCFRIATVLYAKELAPDPWDKGRGHSVLLQLLNSQLRPVLSAVKRYKEEMVTYSSSPYFYNNNPGFAVVESVKPLLVWICILGPMASEANSLSNAGPTGARPPPESDMSTDIYRELLCELVGAYRSDVRQLPDEFWDVCRIGEFRMIKGKDWDLEKSVQRMVDQWPPSSSHWSP